HAADDGEHLGLEFGLAGEIGADAFGAGFEQAAERGRGVVARAIGIGSGEELDEQLTEFGGLRGFVAGAVAFGGEADGVIGREGYRENESGGGGGNSARVAADEFG